MKFLRAAYHAMSGFPGGDLDLRDVAPGLVTLAGPNYSGKTTLLELPLAVWYREWASRTTNDIAKWADARDSWVEAEFLLGADHYRARVNIDAETRKSHAVLQRAHHGGWALVSDGKVSSFDAAMVKLLPPKDAVLCSQFAAQNRAGSLTGAARAKRKDLFMHFLWLERYALMAETAKACALVAEATVASLRSTEQNILFAVALTPVVEDEHAKAVAKVARLTDEVAQIAHMIATTEAERIPLTAEVEAHVAATATAKALVDALEAATFSVTAAQTAMTAAEQSADRVEAALVRNLQRGVADLDAREARATATLVKADAIREAVAATAALQTAYDVAYADLQAGRTAYDAAVALLRDADAAEVVTTVPCQAAQPFASCQFLTAALAATTRLAGRTAADARALVTEAVAQIDAANAELQRTKAASLRVAPLARDAPLIEDAQETMVACAHARTALDAQFARDQWAVRDDRETTLARLGHAWALAEVELAEARRATAEVAEVLERTAGARALVAALDLTLAKARESAQEAIRDQTRAEAEVASAARSLEALAGQRASLAALAPRLVEAEDALRVQSLLARALHRDGLPTLLVAAAAPAISQLATDLLEAAGFGSRFNVNVSTLTPTADGKGWKEDFSIGVFDNVRGKETDIGDLSGGERVLVEEALRCALSIYVGTRHGHVMRTAWRDEAAGPLDSENRPRWVAMLRRMRELGGFDHIVFIAQTEDLVELADVVFDVRDGQATRRTG